jgi:hypothetical protein
MCSCPAWSVRGEHPERVAAPRSQMTAQAHSVPMHPVVVARNGPGWDAVSVVAAADCPSVGPVGRFLREADDVRHLLCCRPLKPFATEPRAKDTARFECSQRQHHPPMCIQPVCSLLVSSAQSGANRCCSRPKPRLGGTTSRDVHGQKSSPTTGRRRRSTTHHGGSPLRPRLHSRSRPGISPAGQYMERVIRLRRRRSGLQDYFRQRVLTGSTGCGAMVFPLKSTKVG